MRINSIDNNTTFQMSLKINPELKPEIIKRGEKFVEQLEDCARKTSTIKKYNVVLDNSLYPKVVNSNNVIKTDYFQTLKSEESNLGRYYEIPSGVQGDTVGGFYPDVPLIFRNVYGENAKEAYMSFKKLSILSQAAEYSRLLEKLDYEKVAKQELEDAKILAQLLKEKSEQDRLEQKVNTLIDKNRLEIEEPKVKKGFFERVFDKYLSNNKK